MSESSCGEHYAQMPTGGGGVVVKALVRQSGERVAEDERQQKWINDINIKTTITKLQVIKRQSEREKSIETTQF